MYPSKYFIEPSAAATTSGDFPAAPQILDSINITRTAQTLPCSPSLPELDNYRLVFKSFMSPAEVETYTNIVKSLHAAGVIVFNDKNKLLIKLTRAQLEKILRLAQLLRPSSKIGYKRKPKANQRG
jgi:hypothetical protein